MQTCRTRSSQLRPFSVLGTRQASGSSKRLRNVPHLVQKADSPSSKSCVGSDVQAPFLSCVRAQLAKPDQSLRSPRKPSLFAELFPEEVGKKATSNLSNEDADMTVPPLPLPTVEELLQGLGIKHSGGSSSPTDATKIASGDAYKHRKIAVLVLQCASKSLLEDDFRRIAPKGTHIDGWTGPGDILTVFPARDPKTFEQTDHYFILFANPAYARAYQSHVHRLYRIARQHTPKCVESPLPVQRGTKFIAGDAYAMLQDFTLCPPSHRLKLLYVYDFLSPGMRSLLDRGGYLRLSDGTNRVGRAVLFWIDGYSPTSREVNAVIASDGRDRGMAWDVSISKLDGSTELAESSHDHYLENSTESYETSLPRKSSSQRWILTFVDESEARRFARVWHRRHLDSPQHHESRTVHAEVLW